MITLKPRTYEALREYAEAIIEVCAPAKLDPIKLLVETDAYGRVAKKLDMCEFICGAFNLAATEYETPMGPLWSHVSAGLEAPSSGKAKGKRQAEPKATAPRLRSRPGGMEPGDFVTPARPKAGLHTLPPPKPPQIAAANALADRVIVRVIADPPAGRPIPRGAPPDEVNREALPPGPAAAPAPGSRAALRAYMNEPAAAKPGKAGKAPKVAKPPKPAKSTRKSRREAAQPRLDL